ncbi:MAG: hypothetical protein HY673_09095 [Chloroflexi bacterium]|nr:hypothetical protein [Chloroflexota bacterium]
MDDQDLLRLLGGYLHPAGDPNPEVAGVEIVWERDNSSFGARHIWTKHHLTEEEVEQVLFEAPPYVEARRHLDCPNRTIFWGATRFDRWIIVICEDWTEGTKRLLRPITAFEPEEGSRYWEKLK